MCLSSVSETLDSGTLIQSGWKEFRGGGGTTLEFMHFTWGKGKRVPLDVWITADGVNTATSNRLSRYDAGFHVYSDEQQIGPLANPRRVYFRRPHTKGMQDGMTVVVARELYVPSDSEAWPTP